MNVQALNDSDLKTKLTETFEKSKGVAEQIKAEKDAVKAAEHREAFKAVYAEFAALKKEADGRKAAATALEQFDLDRQEMEEPEEKLRTKGGAKTDEDRPEPRSQRFSKRHGLKLTADQRQLHAEAFELYMTGQKREAEAVMEKLGKTVQAGKEKFALLESDNQAGGFLVPDDFKAEFLRDLAVDASFRAAGARVVPTSRQQVVWPAVKSPADDKYTSTFVGSWKAEGQVGFGAPAATPPTQQSPAWVGQERIPVHVWQPDVIVVSPEFLDDSAIPVDAVLADLLAEIRALDEDGVFTDGDGVNKPLGLMQDADIGTVNSGAAAALKYSGIMNLWAALRAPYRRTAKWMMNSKTYASTLLLESTGGFPLFPPNSLPGTLLGKEVVFNEFMVDIAAGKTPIIWGAFQNYTIVERVDFRIARLEFYWPQIGIGAYARVGGKCTRPRAFKKQLISA